MKYAYIIFEEITGTQIGVCTSMEEAIAYTQKLQKQSDMRAAGLILFIIGAFASITFFISPTISPAKKLRNNTDTVITPTFTDSLPFTTTPMKYPNATPNKDAIKLAIIINP